MNVNIENNGSITSIESGKIKVPFDGSFGFFVGEEKAELQGADGKYAGTCKGVAFELKYDIRESHLELHIRIQNNEAVDITEPIGLHTGINSYTENYPQWHEPFFPTLLRCEKTHFWGYYMNTSENALAVATSEAVASYNIGYNMFTELDFGHRVTGTDFVFFQNTPLPERHPQNLKVLKAGECYENTIFFIPVEYKKDIIGTIASVASLPMIQSEKFTVEKGDKLNFEIKSNSGVRAVFELPDGSVRDAEGFVFDSFGIYKLRAIDENGKVSEAMFCCREDWDFYLGGAAKEALRKPQIASTHVEGFYGMFSMFLSAKYFDDEYLLAKAYECFNEIMPLMFDFEKCEPTVIPERIQNTALLISLMTDMYEVNPSENICYLQTASRFGDWIMNTQTPDGVYRNKNIHYTCVIYIAKAMLELALAEKNCGDKALEEKYKIHYESVKKAVDELVRNLDNIDTEGELTLEDGMVSCSALQIAMFALTLPEAERDDYIRAAEHMMKIHSCLEQQLIPDCRMNGCSLRYWESQYDVMVRCNMLNSPHGWSAWTAYAHYYLYMLTGKKNYLLSLMNTLGSCAQLLNFDGELRWAFCAQPYVKAESLVPDLSKEVKDGYKFVDTDKKAYRGKYEVREYCEQYVDMISGWYRTGEQKVTGGYDFCPLFLAGGVVLDVDNQGGCCDNDVHEIFKCIEECVLRKAYVYENDDSTFVYFGCKIVCIDGKNEIIINDNIKELVYNLKNECVFGGNAICGFDTINI